MPTCMICRKPATPAASGDSSYVCPRCNERHAHLLDDDDDPDGRADARHLTVLAIDIDD
jgi:hypothetical protein